MGQLGLTYDNLYQLTPRSFWNAVDGFYEMIENEDRKTWIRVRWQTCALVNVHMPKGKSITPQRLMKFEWEKKPGKNKEVSSYEETLFAYEKYMKRKEMKK